MRKETIALIIFMALTAWLGYDKVTGTTTDISPYIKQIADISKTVADLQENCRK